MQSNRNLILRKYNHLVIAIYPQAFLYFDKKSFTVLHTRYHYQVRLGQYCNIIASTQYYDVQY